jgi:conjugal transfer pilus assembly protein TrbC
MRYLGIYFLLMWTCCAQENWLDKAQHIDEESIKWLKEHLKERLLSQDLLQNPLNPPSHKRGKNCQNCGVFKEVDSPLFVCMSFSLKDSLWIEFSKEMEKIGGIFVLRGIPENSFKELAERIFELQSKGVSVPIQIHPKLFQNYAVQLVPAIVVADEDAYDKISGNVTLKFALEKMAREGETKAAKIVYQKWQAAK